jgi:predicted nuclease of predicted toxin-antitoxin system
MALQFFADHCVSTYIIERLRGQGHEVLRLIEHLPTDAPDPVVIAKAQELEAILILLNGDFADIVRYPPSLYNGIIALQIKNHPEITVQIATRLNDHLAVHTEAEQYVGKLLLVEAHRTRIRG